MKCSAVYRAFWDRIDFNYPEVSTDTAMTFNRQRDARRFLIKYLPNDTTFDPHEPEDARFQILIDKIHVCHEALAAPM